MKSRRSGAASRTKLRKALQQLLPNVSLADFEDILSIAEAGHLRHLPAGIVVWQAVTTHIRHNHTDYDHLLAEGYDVESARHFVLEDINEKLCEWGSLRQLEPEETSGQDPIRSQR